MGCGQSSDKKTSNSIEESLSKDANRVRSEVKLLLLVSVFLVVLFFLDVKN